MEYGGIDKVKFTSSGYPSESNYESIKGDDYPVGTTIQQIGQIKIILKILYGMNCYNLVVLHNYPQVLVLLC